MAEEYSGISLTDALWTAVQATIPKVSLPAKAAFLDLTETERLEALQHLPNWLAANAGLDQHRPTLQRYFERRLWPQVASEPTETEPEPTKPQPAKVAAKPTVNSVVELLPNGDQIARGEAPVIWINRSDPRWGAAADRHQRERGKVPIPHGSSYFLGYGYAFPQRYFAEI